MIGMHAKKEEYRRNKKNVKRVKIMQRCEISRLRHNFRFRLFINVSLLWRHHFWNLESYVLKTLSRDSYKIARDGNGGSVAYW